MDARTDSVVISMREGVKFHNGEEMNVEDAIFSQRMNISEEAASTIKVRWARAMEQYATKTGPNSFKILFKEPAPAYLVNGMAEIEMASQLPPASTCTKLLPAIFGNRGE